MWGYTPRVLAGFMAFAHERRKFELAENLIIQATAASNDSKIIKDQLKTLTGEDHKTK